VLIAYVVVNPTTIRSRQWLPQHSYREIRIYSVIISSKFFSDSEKSKQFSILFWRIDYCLTSKLVVYTRKNNSNKKFHDFGQPCFDHVWIITISLMVKLRRHPLLIPINSLIVSLLIGDVIFKLYVWERWCKGEFDWMDCMLDQFDQFLDHHPGSAIDGETGETPTFDLPNDLYGVVVRCSHYFPQSTVCWVYDCKFNILILSRISLFILL
jgi:hypothetical protein